MAKRKTMIPFTGTKEQEEKLQAVIAEHKSMDGALMPVMQKAQDIYGYLPIEVQVMIAEGLGVPLSDVYGVATFYSQFTLNPKGRHPISVCLGTACYVKGSQDILDRLERELGIAVDGVTPDSKFSLEACRCVGACGLAPVMIVGEDVYGKIVPDDVPGILAKYADK
ncbi:MAG: NADH-quinone oxidoreductase subunit NuoE [Clostridia bacterium]|nr:NADH-quinone oxidoreductase subunit NuoE [Clostridia bacterium]